MDRVALFVDGANMFYAQRNKGWFIDWQKVYLYFTVDKVVYGAFYFTGKPHDKEQLKKYRKFRNALMGIGYQVIDKEVTILKDNKTGQIKIKGSLDVEIVWRMLAAEKGYDEVVFLGGDVDFAPILLHLNTIGKRVIVVGDQNTTALEMRNAGNFIELDSIRRYIEKIAEGTEKLQKKFEKTGFVEPQAFNKLPYLTSIENNRIKKILERDYMEIQKCLQWKCWKAAITLCGSFLEAILLEKLKKVGGRALLSPKKGNGPIEDWRLTNYIDVAIDLGLIKEGVDKFAHSVRQYRNLIHPSLEIEGGLKAGEEEAKIAFHVLNMIMRDLEQTLCNE